MLIPLKKNEFLSNQENKKRLINLLTDKLRLAGCSVLQATDDAVLLVVQTAVQAAQFPNTVPVGNDTDLLCADAIPRRDGLE